MSSACNIAVYIHESLICILSAFSNAISIAVFLNPRMKDPSFLYMLSISISDFFYTGFNIYHFTSFCSNFYLNDYFSTQVFDLYFRVYLARCLSVFGILAEIFLSIQRYMLIKNKNYLGKTHHKWLLFSLVIVSLIYNSPVVIYKEVVKTQNNSNQTSIIFKSVNNHMGSSNFATVFNILLSAGRIAFFPLLLTFINVLNAYGLKKRYKRKIFSLPQIKFNKMSDTKTGKISNDISLNNSNTISSTITKCQVKNKLKANVRREKTTQNITHMVIWISILYFVGNAPLLIVNNILISYFFTTITPVLNVLNIFSFALLYLAHGMNIFIYFFFNKRFRNVLLMYIGRIFCLIE